ncbi:hypothetical protein GCM10007853_27970 [Algimonas ampicilliniresistens]|uniref:Uncharacterized protein n=1 Tax=Algimonas ampicilliniresistens TaxID=1298735 RepID=A0ABQ5VDT6_9PROT|nr:hypothetical protein [Algimonas ampicilliniresistens]GLQ24923.1 hypothetical protein GCM10007853_27970 [Algimonas ampicilliniresistens]
MKHCLAACLTLLLVACSANEGEVLPDEIVGADRDNHGCIPSAGYQWSQLRKECIRLWEAGTELTHQGSGDSNYSAFALTQDDKAEVFLPETDKSIMLSRDVSAEAVQSWTDASAEYHLTYDHIAAMILTDQTGFVMYRDTSSEPQFDEIPDHASDELGGEIIVDTGVVTRVEDGAYPMFTIDIRLDEQTEPTTFSLIVEGARITGAPVYELTGHTVTVEYINQTEWDLMDIHPADAETTDDLEIGNGWRFVTGQLTGASEISGGDLPDLLNIQLMGPESVQFELYIDEDMVALNETRVSAWLAPRNSKNIMSIAVTP